MVDEGGLDAEALPDVKHVARNRHRAVVDELRAVVAINVRAAPRRGAVVEQHATRAARRAILGFARDTGNRQRAASGNDGVRAETIRRQRAAEPGEIRDETIRAAQRAVREVVVVDADWRVQLPRAAALVHRVDGDIRSLVQRTRRDQQTRRGDVHRHQVHRRAAHAQAITAGTVDVAVEPKCAAVKVHGRTGVQVEQPGVRAGASDERERACVEINARAR